MAVYNIMLRRPEVQEAVCYTGNQRLGEIGRWAAQYDQATIGIQLGLDTSTMRILSTDDLAGNPETTLDEWFDERVPEE